MSSSSAPPPNVPKLAPFAETQPFRLTEPPNVSWKVGDGLLNTPLGRDWKTDEELGWKTWDMAQTSPSDATQMLNSTVVPRPIAFVSTLSAENKPNLAPFSFFQVVAYHPPIISVSFRLSPRLPKNTRDNILATKQFVVNLISEPFAEAANETSVEAPADVSEWDISGLTQEPSVHVKPARVKESAVSLECELFQSQDIFPDGATVPSATLVLGRVKYMHVRHSVLRSDGLRADPAKLRAISRLGSTTYGRVSEGFDLKKPEWDEVKQILEAQRSSRE
jgi:flavin reductase (DIM6/NTAB) family NADH-FMN oxidoreductase RutF